MKCSGYVRRHVQMVTQFVHNKPMTICICPALEIPLHLIIPRKVIALGIPLVVK